MGGASMVVKKQDPDFYSSLKESENYEANNKKFLRLISPMLKAQGKSANNYQLPRFSNKKKKSAATDEVLPPSGGNKQSPNVNKQNKFFFDPKTIFMGDRVKSGEKHSVLFQNKISSLEMFLQKSKRIMAAKKKAWRRKFRGRRNRRRRRAHRYLHILKTRKHKNTYSYMLLTPLGYSRPVFLNKKRMPYWAKRTKKNIGIFRAKKSLRFPYFLFRKKLLLIRMSGGPRKRRQKLVLGAYKNLFFTGAKKLAKYSFNKTARRTFYKKRNNFLSVKYKNSLRRKNLLKLAPLKQKIFFLPLRRVSLAKLRRFRRLISFNKLTTTSRIRHNLFSAGSSKTKIVKKLKKKNTFLLSKAKFFFTGFRNAPATGKKRNNFLYPRLFTKNSVFFKVAYSFLKKKYNRGWWLKLYKKRNSFRGKFIHTREIFLNNKNKFLFKSGFGSSLLYKRINLVDGGGSLPEFIEKRNSNKFAQNTFKTVAADRIKLLFLQKVYKKTKIRFLEGYSGLQFKKNQGAAIIIAAGAVRAKKKAAALVKKSISYILNSRSALFINKIPRRANFLVYKQKKLKKKFINPVFLQNTVFCKKIRKFRKKRFFFKFFKKLLVARNLKKKHFAAKKYKNGYGLRVSQQPTIRTAVIKIKQKVKSWPLTKKFLDRTIRFTKKVNKRRELQKYEFKNFNFKIGSRRNKRADYKRLRFASVRFFNRYRINFIKGLWFRNNFLSIHSYVSRQSQNTFFSNIKFLRSANSNNVRTRVNSKKHQTLRKFHGSLRKKFYFFNKKHNAAFVYTDKKKSSQKFLPTAKLLISGHALANEKYYKYSEKQKTTSARKKRKWLAGRLFNLYRLYKKKIQNARDSSKGISKKNQYTAKLASANFFFESRQRRKLFKNAVFFKKIQKLQRLRAKKLKKGFIAAHNLWFSKKKRQKSLFFSFPVYIKTQKQKSFLLHTFFLLFLFNVFFFTRKLNITKLYNQNTGSPTIVIGTSSGVNAQAALQAKKISLGFMSAVLSFRLLHNQQQQNNIATSSEFNDLNRRLPHLTHFGVAKYASENSAKNLYFLSTQSDSSKTIFRHFVFFSKPKLHNLLFKTPVTTCSKISKSTIFNSQKNNTSLSMERSGGVTDYIKKNKIRFYLSNTKNIFKAKINKIFYPKKKLAVKYTKYWRIKRLAGLSWVKQSISLYKKKTIKLLSDLTSKTIILKYASDQKYFLRLIAARMYYVKKSFEFIFSEILFKLFLLRVNVFFTNVLQTLTVSCLKQRKHLFQKFLLTVYNIRRNAGLRLRTFYFNFFNLYFYAIYFKNLILFLNFLNKYFKTINDQRRLVKLSKNLISRCAILKINKSLIGLKLVISGKLNKRPRSRSTMLLYRRISGTQALDTKIYYAAKQLFNKFGSFGTKFWLYSF